MTKKTQKSKCCNELAKKNTKRDGYRCSKCKKDCEIKKERKKGKRGMKKKDNMMVSRKTAEVAKIGRPTIYSDELADTIYHRIAKGESLLAICKDEGMPSRITVHQWVLDNEDFSNKYARARELQAEFLFDETIELSDKSPDDITGDDKSDGARIAARRLQVDTRKFYISKVLPKKYGEKIDITSGGEKIQNNSITFVDFSKPIKKDD